MTLERESEFLNIRLQVLLAVIRDRQGFSPLSAPAVIEEAEKLAQWVIGEIR